MNCVCGKTVFSWALPCGPPDCTIAMAALRGSREPSFTWGFPCCEGTFPLRSPRPAPPVLRFCAPWPWLCASCAFTRLNASTAVTQPAGLQDSGAMLLLLVLLMGLDGLHTRLHASKSRCLFPSWSFGGDFVRRGLYSLVQDPGPDLTPASPSPHLLFPCPLL